MVEKATKYERVRFDPQAYEDGWDVYLTAVRELLDDGIQLVHPRDMSVGRGAVQWTFDDWHEFLGAVRDDHDRAHVEFSGYTSGVRVYLDARDGGAYVSITAANRGTVERLSAPWNRAAERLQQPIPDWTPPVVRPRVFIGHGRSQAWRDLKDHLHDHHGYDVEAYETGARAGHTIRDVLEQMMSATTFAVLVMTAEDEQAPVDGDEHGTVRARQNVVHEAGLFQGRLGFSRAVILLEEGTESFSNIDGVQYIRFGRGRIREAFGDVLATLRREFPVP
ncbi:MAG: hypothetical protein K0S37_3082 [Microbacterium sp.]|jgi:predicted nucleotide-binding protein|nr:hypothetical protein [Microbacterium sp.]